MKIVWISPFSVQGIVEEFIYCTDIGHHRHHHHHPLHLVVQRHFSHLSFMFFINHAAWQLDNMECCRVFVLRGKIVYQLCDHTLTDSSTPKGNVINSPESIKVFRLHWYWARIWNYTFTVSGLWTPKVPNNITFVL